MISSAIIQQNLSNTIAKTDFPTLGEKYSGKVRDCYIKDKKRILIATDRISAFDHILKQQIPFKGQVLNQIAAYFMESTKDIVENHIIDIPDPNVVVAKQCKMYPIELVVRGYLAGSAFRDYEGGKRKICGINLPDGLRMNEKLEKPIITPSTKAVSGHDENISKEEIVEKNLVPALVFEKIEEVSLALFERGTKMADERGLVLVDTKYEFADYNGDLILVDEIHTPDSSRYFFKDKYKEDFENNRKQHQLSKEFLREWLMANNFQGKDFEVMPDLPPEIIIEVASRYIALFEQITGKEFVPDLKLPILERLTKNLTPYL